MKPKYTQYDFDQALQAVANGQSVRKAAIDWAVPRSTLQARINGRDTHRVAAQSQMRLSLVQEEHLVGWILTQETVGIPLSHVQIYEIASQVLATKGDTNPLGKT